MRVQSDTELITFNEWTVRIRRAATQPARLLLLLHGWTGTENSMWVFVRNFPSDYWMLAPRAPHAAESEGYSWRPLKAGPHQAPDLDDLLPAAHSLIDLVDAYRLDAGITDETFSVIGFSQGAALANTLAILHPTRIRRVGVLAGFVPLGAQSLLADRPLSGIPFFVAHGTLDEMVKVEYARQSVDILQKAGAQVTFCEDEVGHRVSANCLRALESFFA